jgi:hypothetical protein
MATKVICNTSDCWYNENKVCTCSVISIGCDSLCEDYARTTKKKKTMKSNYYHPQQNKTRQKNNPKENHHVRK